MGLFCFSTLSIKTISATNPKNWGERRPVTTTERTGLREELRRCLLGSDKWSQPVPGPASSWEAPRQVPRLPPLGHGHPTADEGVPSPDDRTTISLEHLPRGDNI